jgi:predicted  nucleic acid-binding Zn-ribbon protein
MQQHQHLAALQEELNGAAERYSTAAREHDELMKRLNATRSNLADLTTKARAANTLGNEAEYSALALRVRFAEEDVAELTTIVAKASEAAIAVNGDIARIEQQQRVAKEAATAAESEVLSNRITKQIDELTGMLSAARAALRDQLQHQGGEILAKHQRQRCIEAERELLAEVATTYDVHLSIDPPASARSRSRLQSCHDFFRPSAALKDLIHSGAKPRI